MLFIHFCMLLQLRLVYTVRLIIYIVLQIVVVYDTTVHTWQLILSDFFLYKKHFPSKIKWLSLMKMAWLYMFFLSVV